MKIAIIGAGVSGLGAARALAPRHEVELYEAGMHVGGHVATVDVTRASTGERVPVDTGFIIFNERTYPLFSRLVAELGVPTRTTEMSFSSTCRRCGLELGSGGVSALFARPGAARSPRHWRLLAEILRFFWVGQQALHDQRTESLTLGELLARKAIARDAVDHFVVPMGAAIWSTPARQMLDFPAQAFLRFQANHGMLAPVGAPRWRTIVGGGAVYVRALCEAYRLRVQRATPVARLERDDDGVDVVLGDGTRRRFDAAVVATHSDQALALLAAPTDDERRLLGAIGYTDNDVWLHTDESFLPAPRARASWNYQTEDCRAPEHRVSATYWMNRLQGLPGPEQYLVTLNPTRPIASGKVIRRFTYAHPRFDFAAMRAQRQLARLQGRRRTYFCGAYFGFGFHEDGLRSGIEAAAALERDAARGHEGVSAA
jgi:predicted NAD/FAD-binding protein